MIAIYKKEIRAYFTQMIGYMFLAFFMAIIALFFIVSCVMGGSPEFQGVLSGSTIVFFILIPAITMRLFSEESRHKTDQLLYTSPITVGQIVVGKYLAALTLYTIGIVASFLFPLMISRFGMLPVSQIMTAYLGYYLLGACFIAVGMFVSVMTNNQIIAAVASFAVIFLMYVMDSLVSIVPSSPISSVIFVVLLIIGVTAIFYLSTKNVIASAVVGVLGAAAAVILYLVNNLIYDGFIVKTMQWLSVYGRYGNMTNGIFNLSDLVYYISFTVLFIYLAVNVIEKRRWR